MLDWKGQRLAVCHLDIEGAHHLLPTVCDSRFQLRYHDAWLSLQIGIREDFIEPDRTDLCHHRVSCTALSPLGFSAAADLCLIEVKQIDEWNVKACSEQGHEAPGLVHALSFARSSIDRRVATLKLGHDTQEALDLVDGSETNETVLTIDHSDVIVLPEVLQQLLLRQSHFDPQYPWRVLDVIFAQQLGHLLVLAVKLELKRAIRGADLHRAVTVAKPLFHLRIVRVLEDTLFELTVGVS